MIADQNPPSLSFAVGERTPLQREINADINDQFQAVANGDLAGQKRRREALFAKVDAFERSGGDGHSNPLWICPILRAHVHNAFGEYEEAERLERQALGFAADDQQRARNYNNLSEYTRRSGRHPEAVEYAKQAVRLWPDNEGMGINLAICLFRDGRNPEAQRIIVGMARILPDLDDGENILAAFARFEQEFREMILALPRASETEALRELVARTKGAKA